MSRLFQHLYWKISAVFLCLLLALGVVLTVLSVHSAVNFLRETDQQLNRNLARDLAQELNPYLRDTLNVRGIEASFHHLMVMNPRVELYFLDETGHIVAFFAAPEKVKRQTVDLQPVHHFLTKSENLPVLGDDPRRPGRKKPFSVTHITYGQNKQGYLYVILGGEEFDTASDMIKGSYIVRTTVVGLGVTIFFTGLVGLIGFAFLTKRFRRMTAAVRKFEHGDLRERIAVHSQDEIGQLANAFNQMANTIEENMEELQRTDRLRRELVANISHDLRSPLASMQGYLETIQMKEGILSAQEHQKYFRIIFDNTRQLSELVDELFELSKLDANQVQPHAEAFSLAELTQDVVMKFRPKAEKLNIKLEMVLDKTLPSVYADIGMIERALCNLIDNALQYTPENGVVEVKVFRKEQNIRVTVEDTGYGIPEEEIPFIFDRFYRVDKSRTRTGGGTGLGLAIAKKILELHQKTIFIKSVLNQGTTLWFDLNVVR